MKKTALLLLPQRYEFSSKSQRRLTGLASMESCCCYRKGTNFQANHNFICCVERRNGVVVATAKVRIFKQITTWIASEAFFSVLLLLPQRYEFSSKSQLYHAIDAHRGCCCCYRKGTNFQANHNLFRRRRPRA